MPLVFSTALFAGASDPITDFMTRDWAGLGGWSLFVSLSLLIVLGSFKELWVPGARLRRQEKISDKFSEANMLLLKQNGQLTQNNEIVKHFMDARLDEKDADDV